MEIDEIDNQSGFTENFIKWCGQSGLPPLTNTQHHFAEWLLLEENRKKISQIGNISCIFESVRTYLKNN